MHIAALHRPAQSIRSRVPRRLARGRGAGWCALFLGALLVACSDGPVSTTDPSSTKGGTVPIPETNLRGQVVDNVSGVPLAGATVSAVGVSTTTAADGTYNLQRLQINAALVMTTRAGYDTATTLLPLNGRDQVFNVRLRPAAVAAGH